MSVITAEVKVDETDIVNVSLDQLADVTIDAMPNRTFHGHVTEIGDTAILRSTGVAASQSTTSNQEAKDFKVVIALDDPPDDIRPGLSCTGKITTATKPRVLTIPIQALTVRKRGDLDPAKKNTTQCRPHPCRSRRRESQEGRAAGRIRDPRRQGGVRAGHHGDHRRHRYRSAERAEGRRSDHYRHLQGDPDPAQFRQGEGQQQVLPRTDRKASAWRRQPRNWSTAARI